MNEISSIKHKLELFIKKYYLNELLKGVIFFFFIGLLYFLFTLFIENLLWLSVTGRTILFWLFIVIEGILLFKFILYPIFKLLKISKGIDYTYASSIIGNHFPTVNDKLLNLLQLSDTNISTDLLEASITQKSLDLQPVPFSLAINLKNNLKYLKYAAIPVFLLLFSYLFNKTHWITDSYNRVVNYKTPFIPPAPFTFKILNTSLSAQENTDFVLKVSTAGSIIPENVSIQYNDETYILNTLSPGEFEYVFSKPSSTIDFTLSANDVTSLPFSLTVESVPVLLDFSMSVYYPKHTRGKNKIYNSTGNAIVPEGSIIKWKVHTKNTTTVSFNTKDSIYNLPFKDDVYTHKQSLFSNLNYSISTSNEAVKNHDNLNFSLKIIKDQYPELNIESKIDSIKVDNMFFYGKVSDDYGLSKLHLAYYETSKPNDIKYHTIPVSNEAFDNFLFTFPSVLDLKEGISYDYYFEVFDNDKLHNYKSTKSQVYSYKSLTKNEKEDLKLQKQSTTISSLHKSLSKFKKQKTTLSDISKTQIEKKKLDFNDKQKLNDFIKSQENQSKDLLKLSDQLKENLNQFKSSETQEPFKDALKEKLERAAEKLKKKEALLKELEELKKKLSPEELSKKLDELDNKNNTIEKSLEQILELTKRYYVVEKHSKIVNDLEKLAKEQEKLSKNTDDKNTKEEQDKLTKEFNKLKDDLDELNKQNKDLKKPLDLKRDKKQEEEISKEQNEASQKLDKKNNSEAKKNQKSAAQKMKNMAGKMGMQMQMSGSQQQQEDVKMLRQILDNLVVYSLEQEVLMKKTSSISLDDPLYSQNLKKQNILRDNFVHIDDSLYALALRTPKISDFILEKITVVDYNIDNSISKLSENQSSQASANQQYAVTGSNDLAYMLSKTLNQMQNSLPMPGKGKKGGEGEFQLPDLIKKQEELIEEMSKGSKPSKKPNGDKEGDEKGDKKGGDKNGNSSGDKKGKDGKGKDGKGKPKDGKNGKEGSGTTESDSENNDGKLFEIYKQQQQLRKALQDQINKMKPGDKPGPNLLNQMEQIEQQLLDKGFDSNVTEKMKNLKHELLKLESATKEQGEEERKESITNTLDFEKQSNKELEIIKQYFNTSEILNRHILPLRQNYKSRVKQYFNQNND